MGSYSEQRQAIEDYIRQAAATRKIDPEIALKVARSEGLGQYVGDNGSSFGPYQLHYGGVAKGGNAVTGLGDEFTRQTGLDARDPSTWRQQVDFSLAHAAKNGWGPWHGWKGSAQAGIGASPIAPQSTEAVADESGDLESPSIIPDQKAALRGLLDSQSFKSSEAETSDLPNFAKLIAPEPEEAQFEAAPMVQHQYANFNKLPNKALALLRQRGLLG